MRVLQRRSKERGLTGKRAGHSEVFFAGGNRIGANAKLELAGNRLGAILGVGVRNDIAKLVTSSIYKRLRRWHTIWSSNAAAGDEEGL
jgi:hypothetical protein